MDNRTCLFSVFILSTFFSCSTCFAYLLTEEHFSTNVVRSKVLSVVTNQVEGGFSVVSTVERHWQRNERNGSENLLYFDTFRVVAETSAGRQKLIFDSEHGCDSFVEDTNTLWLLHYGFFAIKIIVY